MLKKYNPAILGNDPYKKLSMAMDGLPEIDNLADPNESFAIKEDFNKRRDFLKCILASTLLKTEFRRG